MSSWVCEYFGLLAHVIPINDLKPHDKRPDCWCKPTEDYEAVGLYVHNSMDRREEYEQGKPFN